MEEGRVASFLLATTVILQLRFALMKKMMFLEVGLFHHLLFFLSLMNKLIPSVFVACRWVLISL